MSLWDVDIKIGEMRSQSSVRHMTVVDTISKELEGWRALLDERSAGHSDRSTFWSKLPLASARADATPSRARTTSNTIPPQVAIAPSQAPRKESRARTSSDGSSSQGDSRSHSDSRPSTRAAAAPCDEAPHCPKFFRRHAKKQKNDPARNEEYKFLYAAQAQCLQCLEYYTTVPNFNLHCQSKEKNARQWAQADEEEELTRTIGPEIEEWLSRVHL